MAQRAVIERTPFWWKPARPPSQRARWIIKETQSHPDPAESGADIAKKVRGAQRRILPVCGRGKGQITPSVPDPTLWHTRLAMERENAPCYATGNQMREVGSPPRPTSHCPRGATVEH